MCRASTFRINIFVSHSQNSVTAVSDVLPFPEHKQSPYLEHGALAFHTNSSNRSLVTPWTNKSKWYSTSILITLIFIQINVSGFLPNF